MRSSATHPIQIAVVQPGSGLGEIGLTFCPGKVQPGAMSGTWHRDLGTDLDAIATWGAVSVVTLVEDHELSALKVTDIGAEVVTRHMAWHHLPIRDVSTPGKSVEEAWELIGEMLRGQLRSGFNVLVHCKGGLGRAGTIAARLLIELGTEPTKAVAAVRATRPGAIETKSQLDYVMRLKAVPERQPSTTGDAIRDRAIGSLLGLAIGDAVGTTLEFKARGARRCLTDMVGGGPFGLEPGQWTDDTAMALALVDSLAANASLDEVDLMHRFVDWHEKGTYSCTGACFDIGITTSQALSRWKRSGDPFAGSTDPRTAGNGSLMRLAPVAIRHFRNRPLMRDVAARQSRTTHGAPEAVDACVAYAEVLADAIEGASRSEVLKKRDETYAGAIASIMAGSWRGKHRDAIRSSGYVAHSLEASLWSVGRAGVGRDAVLTAANLGEDADTTAAVTGQLVGALCGCQNLPREWVQRVRWSQRIRAMAEALICRGRT